MEMRTVGPLTLPSLGLGCMGMSGGYGVEDPDSCVATVRRAVDVGVSLIDTADFYAGGQGEELIGRALAGVRDRVTLMVKTGIRPKPEGGMMLDGRPEYLREAVDESLRRLKTDRIDLYCLAWRDPAVPIGESVGAMAELVQAGKVRHLALCEVSPRTLRAAQRVHPIAAVVTEYSLWERHVEAEILGALRESGCGLLAYAPLGRGFLTGTVTGLAHLDEGDWRHNFPRFADGNIEQNLKLLEPVREIADRVGLTLSQLALAWVLHRGKDIVALFGAKVPDHVTEDVAALGVTLSDADLAALDECFPPGEIAGERYGPSVTPLIDA